MYMYNVSAFIYTCISSLGLYFLCKIVSFLFLPPFGPLCLSSLVPSHSSRLPDSIRHYMPTHLKPFTPFAPSSPVSPPSVTQPLVRLSPPKSQAIPQPVHQHPSAPHPTPCHTPVKSSTNRPNLRQAAPGPNHSPPTRLPGRTFPPVSARVRKDEKGDEKGDEAEPQQEKKEAQVEEDPEEHGQALDRQIKEDEDDRAEKNPDSVVEGIKRPSVHPERQERRALCGVKSFSSRVDSRPHIK